MSEHRPRRAGRAGLGARRRREGRAAPAARGPARARPLRRRARRPGRSTSCAGCSTSSVDPAGGDGLRQRGARRSGYTPYKVLIVAVAGGEGGHHRGHAQGGPGALQPARAPASGCSSTPRSTTRWTCRRCARTPTTAPSPGRTTATPSRACRRPRSRRPGRPRSRPRWRPADGPWQYFVRCQTDGVVVLRGDAGRAQRERRGGRAPTGRSDPSGLDCPNRPGAAGDRGDGGRPSRSVTDRAPSRRRPRPARRAPGTGRPPPAGPPRPAAAQVVPAPATSTRLPNRRPCSTSGGRDDRHLGEHRRGGRGLPAGEVERVRRGASGGRRRRRRGSRRSTRPGAAPVRRCRRNSTEVRCAGIRAPANTSSSTTSTRARRHLGEPGAGVGDVHVEAQPVGGQPGAHQVDQRAVELHDALRRAGAGGRDVPGQRPRAAAEVQHAQRRGRRGIQRVEQVTDPADVLELEVGRVGEVDVALRGAVDEQRPGRRAVGVGHELGPPVTDLDPDDGPGEPPSSCRIHRGILPLHAPAAHPPPNA